MSQPPHVQDTADPAPVLKRETLHDGMIWNYVAERVDLGDGGVVRREFLEHPGAVGILALDDNERVLLVRQYRHPVGRRLWEVPAGLLDVPEEDALDCAARELAEEADLRAIRWNVLADWFNSPGGSDEAVRVYLARGLSPVPEEDRHSREAEELGMETRWVPLDEALDAVLEGRIHNPTTVVGVMAASIARSRDWATLRPADAPWPERPQRLTGPHGAG